MGREPVLRQGPVRQLRSLVCRDGRGRGRQPNLNWIIKLHPANLWKRQLSGVTSEYGEIAPIRERVGKSPHVRALPPDMKIGTLLLFRSIDAGMTVRGSIGDELPCFGVPVVTAGTGRYSGFDFTLDHDSAESYLATLARLETVPRLDRRSRAPRQGARSHALFARRPWVYRSFRSEIGADVKDPLHRTSLPLRRATRSSYSWAISTPSPDGPRTLS